MDKMPVILVYGNAGLEQTRTREIIKFLEPSKEISVDAINKGALVIDGLYYLSEAYFSETKLSKKRFYRSFVIRSIDKDVKVSIVLYNYETQLPNGQYITVSLDAGTLEIERYDELRSMCQKFITLLETQESYNDWVERKEFDNAVAREIEKREEAEAELLRRKQNAEKKIALQNAVNAELKKRGINV